MWTFFAGPLFALLPRQWRERLPFSDKIHWRAAAFLSGLIEAFLALLALVYWYSISVTHWAQGAVVMAERKGAVIPPNTEGFAGLVLVAMHPLTWIIVVFGIEAAVRVCAAAFTGEILGSLPLFAIAKAVGSAGTNQPSPFSRSITQSSAAKSAYHAIREKYLLSQSSNVPDELCFTEDAHGQTLEIRSCRPKPNWEAPCIVSYEGSYYRLESTGEGARPRLFVFSLRRLAAGVPSRTVRVYSPDLQPITINR